MDIVRFGGALGSLSLKRRSSPAVFIRLSLLWNMIYFVLAAFADILLARYHTVILLSSLLIDSNNSGKFGPDFSAEVSSANRKVLREVQFGKSFIKIRNKVGPSKLPCITDMSTYLGWERLPVPLMSTTCDLPVR